MELTYRMIVASLFTMGICLNSMTAQTQKVFIETANDSAGNKIISTYAYDYSKKQQIGNSSIFVYDSTGKLIKHFEKDDNGTVQGCFIEYYPNGMVKSKANYNDGFRAGAYTEYYSNGKLKVHGMFQDQLSDFEKQCLCEEYGKENLETGEFETRIQCADGVKVSYWYFFDEQGNVDRLYKY